MELGGWRLRMGMMELGGPEVEDGYDGAWGAGG